MVSGGNNVAEGLKHMESVLPHVLMQTAGQTSIEQDDQAVLLIQLEILRRQLALGTDPDTIKERLNDCKKSLDHFSGVMDARVYASFYQASYEYSKVKGNPQEYYTNSLLYLTYTPLSSLSLSTQASLASDIGLAALLGKNIYNFGELLQNPILKTLDSTEYVWLPKMLQAFNQGNIKAFNDIFGQVKDKYVSSQKTPTTSLVFLVSFFRFYVHVSKSHTFSLLSFIVCVVVCCVCQPTLAANVAFLNQKLRIMTLMELVFRLPSGSKAGTASGAASASSSSSSLSAPSEQRGRFLTFDAISKGCDLPVDQVEWLLMKSLALKVIKGEIDQVDQSIRLTWVSPRVLDIEQVKSLKNRLSVWQQEVEQTTVFVENNAQQII